MGLAKNLASLKMPQKLQKETYPGTGSTEDPKQDKPKQTYTKQIVLKMRGSCERGKESTPWEATWEFILLHILFHLQWSVFSFFFPAPAACRSSWARDQTRATATNLCHTATVTPDQSHVCDLHHSSRQYQILNPLSEARDRPHVLMDTSWIHNAARHSRN